MTNLQSRQGGAGFFFLSINFLATTLNHSYGISVGHQCKKAAAKLGKYVYQSIFFPTSLNFPFVSNGNLTDTKYINNSNACYLTLFLAILAAISQGKLCIKESRLQYDLHLELNHHRISYWKRPLKFVCLDDCWPNKCQYAIITGSPQLT